MHRLLEPHSDWSKYFLKLQSNCTACWSLILIGPNFLKYFSSIYFRTKIFHLSVLCLRLFLLSTVTKNLGIFSKDVVSHLLECDGGRVRVRQELEHLVRVHRPKVRDSWHITYWWIPWQKSCDLELHKVYLYFVHEKQDMCQCAYAIKIFIFVILFV